MSNQLLQHLVRLIADDSHACTFQSLGQYRKSLLQTATQSAEAAEPATKHMAAELMARLVDSGAINYLEDQIEVTVEKTGQQLLCHIVLQHPAGKSHHELRVPADRRAEAAEQKVAVQDALLNDISTAYWALGADLPADIVARLQSVSVTAPPATQDVAVLMREHRIAVTPEHEGQWHADLYGHEEEPIVRAEGDTPEQAVLAVVAAYRSGSPEGQNLPQQEGDQ